MSLVPCTMIFGEWRLIVVIYETIETNIILLTMSIRKLTPHPIWIVLLLERNTTNGANISESLTVYYFPKFCQSEDKINLTWWSSIQNTRHCTYTISWKLFVVCAIKKFVGLEGVNFSVVTIFLTICYIEKHVIVLTIDFWHPLFRTFAQVSNVLLSWSKKY